MQARGGSRMAVAKATRSSGVMCPRATNCAGSSIRIAARRSGVRAGRDRSGRAMAKAREIGVTRQVVAGWAVRPRTQRLFQEREPARVVARPGHPVERHAGRSRDRHHSRAPESCSATSSPPTPSRRCGAWPPASSERDRSAGRVPRSSRWARRRIAPATRASSSPYARTPRRLDRRWRRCAALGSAPG